MEGPMRATPDDYDSIISLVDTCFPDDAEKGGMEGRWSHVYSTDPDQIRRSVIVKDGKKPVAHVRYVDQRCLVEGSELKVAGIHGVCTHPDYRGKGIMRRVIGQTIEFIEEENYALSDLGGVTPLYRRFGWEDGGREWTFNITNRSITQLTPPADWTVSEYSKSDEDLNAIENRHENETLRVHRTEQSYRSILGRICHETYLASRGSDSAYLTVDSDNPSCRSVVEFGGSTEGIHALLAYLVKDKEVKELTVKSPWRHPANPLFRNLCDGCSIRPMRMIRIINLVDTLKAFEGQIRRRYESLGTVKTVDFGVAIAESGESVSIHLSPEETAITPEIKEDALRLNSIEAIRLLFGPGTPNIADEKPHLDILFPLDFYIWGAERV